MKPKLETLATVLGLFVVGLLGTGIVGFIGGFILGFTGNVSVIQQPEQFPIISNLFLGFTSLGYGLLILPYIQKYGIQSPYSEEGNLELGIPNEYDLKLIGVGVVISLSIATLMLIVINYSPFKLESSIINNDGGIVATISFSIASILLIAPGEELLFRCVLQNRLEYSFDTSGAIIGSSTLFGLIHIPNYTGDTVAIAIAILALSIIGGVFAYVYSRSGNILVPVLTHGLYNAILSISGLIILNL